jgi:hypothetical protein
MGYAATIGTGAACTVRPYGHFSKNLLSQLWFKPSEKTVHAGLRTIWP